MKLNPQAVDKGGAVESPVRRNATELLNAARKSRGIFIGLAKAL